MSCKYSNKSLIIRRLTVLLTAAVFVFGMCLYPVDCWAVDKVGATQESTGYVDISGIDEDLSVEEGEDPSFTKKKIKKLRASLPDSYDPRNMDYYKNHVKVLDQGSSDLCWAYSSCTASHISFLKELYEKGESIDGDYEPSVKQFAYYFYNRSSYPYGYNGSDKNVALSGDYKSNGGNNYLAAQAMANWMGMARNSETDISDPSKAYNNYMTLENARYLTNTTAKDEDGDTVSVLNVEAVKSAIQENGAVAAQIYTAGGKIDKYLYSKTDYEKNVGHEVEGGDEVDQYMGYYCNYTYNKSSSGSVDHAVTIIGWDDNFSVERFDPRNRPENDGAWIVQNSWGVDSNYNLNDKGFIYVSYEDLSLSGAIAYDMQPADAYDANYQYDGNSYYSKTGTTLSIGSQFANVFTVPDDGKRHTLDAVAFTTWNSLKTDYEIKIYKGVSTTPTTGDLAATFTASTDCAGNYTFDLSDNGVDPVYLDNGEKFAISVSATETAVEDELFHIGLEKTKTFSWIKFSSTGKKQTSYYKASGSKSWKDLYSENTSASFRIKALTNVVEKRSVAEATVTLSQYNYDYTGETIKAYPEVTYNGETLTKGTDYSLVFKNHRYPGTASVTVKGKGLYKDTNTVEYTIGGINNFRASSVGKTYIRLRWDKSPKVTGYKIYKYKSGKYKLIKTISSSKTLTYKNTKLKADTTYKYKMRTYKKVGKKYHYGPYTPILPVTTDPKE